MKEVRIKNKLIRHIRLFKTIIKRRNEINKNKFTRTLHEIIKTTLLYYIYYFMRTNYLILVI